MLGLTQLKMSEVIMTGRVTPNHNKFLSLQMPYEWSAHKWFSVAFNTIAALLCLQAKHKNY